MTDIDTLSCGEANGPVYRIIPSRNPRICLFERVFSPQDWDEFYAVESLTNPRLRDEVGDIHLVPPEDRLYGDGASWIMAALTHPPADGRGGRFNRDFGVCYCAADEAVAIGESLCSSRAPSAGIRNRTDQPGNAGYPRTAGTDNPARCATPDWRRHLRLRRLPGSVSARTYVTGCKKLRCPPPKRESDWRVFWRDASQAAFGCDSLALSALPLYTGNDRRC